MGADPIRSHEQVWSTVWVTPPEPAGFAFDFDTDWRDWSFGVLFDTGPVEFGASIWLGPFFVRAGYRRPGGTDAR